MKNKSKSEGGKIKRVRCGVPRSMIKNPCEAKTKQGKDCSCRAVQKYGDRWLCIGHARSMGLRGDEVQWKESVASGVGKRKKIREQLLTKFDEESKRDYFLGLDTKTFDFAIDYPKIRDVNPLPFTECGSEKYAVGLWMMASQESRQPQNLAEVADMLGLALPVIETWIRSNEMLDIFDDASNRRMRAKRAMMDAILVSNCINNHRWALELYYREYVTEHKPVGAPKQEPKFESEHTMTLKEVIKEKGEVPRLKSQTARVLLQKLKKANPEGALQVGTGFETDPEKLKEAEELNAKLMDETLQAADKEAHRKEAYQSGTGGSWKEREEEANEKVEEEPGEPTD